VDYLKSLLSFPKHLIEAGMLEVLTEEVIKHEHEVHDVAQNAAEELYISLCQQLDGYGQETFMARNEDGIEVVLGISVSGVIVGNSGSQKYYKFFPWREIVNVVNHKRTFSIECTDQGQNVSFSLNDAETGRYIWKLCVNQHTFFMNYEQNYASQVNLSLFQNISENFTESREDLLSNDDKMYYSNTHLSMQNPNSSSNLAISTNNMFIPSTESLLVSHPNHVDSRSSLQASTADLHNQININPMLASSQQWNLAGSNTSLINRAQSSSCVDLTNSNTNINNHSSNNNISNSNNNNINLIASSNSNLNKEKFLPKYRPAPSYEAALQQKYYKGSQTDVSIPPQPHLMYENYGHSQMLHHQISSQNLHQQQQQPQQQHFPDVTHVTSNNNIINPSYVDAYDYLSQRLKLLSFNPPPQYPNNRLSSTSTPDLALASHRGLFGYRQSGSSPDLVSSRNLLHQQHGFIPYTSATALTSNGIPKQRLRHSHSFLPFPHATYENLNFIDASSTNHSFFPSTKHIPNNNMIYRTTSSAAAQQLADMEYYLHKQQHRNHSLNALNLSNSHISEPIYENVPLPESSSPSSANATNVERKISFEHSSSVNSNSNNNSNNNSNTNNNNRPVRIAKPRVVQQTIEPSTPAVAATAAAAAAATVVNSDIVLSTKSSMVNAYSNNGSSKNINDPLNGIENAKRHFVSTTTITSANNDKNGNKITGSASINNISTQQERDVNLNHVNFTTSSSGSGALAINSPFYSEMQTKNQSQRQQITANTTFMNTSGTSSNYTINTTTTADTTDSGISTEMGKKESKRNKFWNMISGNKNKNTSTSSSASGKQKSATLGREKDKSKKDKSREAIDKEAESNMKHRWSTGLPKLQPLPANISKEKLCQLLDAKLNDSQLFLEFERIPKRKENAQYTCALMEENRNKNSDPTCIPMDENRVKLIPMRENRLGYMNASYISVSVYL
jgi:tyrosine-protein phosphatase non-receptor type 14/21